MIGARPLSVSWWRGGAGPDWPGMTTRRLFLLMLSGEVADLFRDPGEGETEGEGAVWYPLLPTSSISCDGGLGDSDCWGDVSRDSL